MNTVNNDQQKQIDNLTSKLEKHIELSTQDIINRSSNEKIVAVTLKLIKARRDSLLISIARAQAELAIYENQLTKADQLGVVETLQAAQISK